MLKSLRQRLETLGLVFAEWFVPKLPRRTCAWLGETMGGLLFHLARHSRHVALANINAVYGNSLPAAERRRIAKMSFRNFGRGMIDLFWSPRLTADNWRDFLKVEGMENIEDTKKNDVGRIFVASHAGAFEWGFMPAGFLGLHGIGVAETYRNEALTGTFHRLRGICGQEIIPQQGAFLRMFKHLKRGGTVGSMVDLSIHPKQAATIIRSFGREACTPMLHAVLQERIGVAIMPIVAEAQPDGTCRVHFLPALRRREGETVQHIAQRTWDVFESFIREKPERWLWAYKHWRHLPADATVPYPFYANSSKPFEKLKRTLAKAR